MSEKDLDIQPEQRRSGKGGYIVGIILLMAGIATMAYLMKGQKDTIDDLRTSGEECQSELDAAYAVFNSNGEENETIDNLASEMQNVFIQFENMEMANVEMSDSIQAQQDRLRRMMDELEAERKSKKRNARKIVALKQEIETMRGIMRHYVHVIDSLGQENKRLQTDLNRTTNELTRKSDSLRGAKEDIEYLSEKMATGSLLSAAGFTSEALRITSSGSQKETRRAKRANAIRSCFTLAKNRIAKKGDKQLYMVVKDPSGNVMYRSSSNAFVTNDGKNMVYSDVKVIKYNNETIDVCIFYEHDGEFQEGDYTIEIWSDGAKIGSDKLGLK